MADSLPPGVREVARIPAPGGGTWVLGDDGGVFALDGAQFHGAYTTLSNDQRQGDRQGWKGIEARPNGGYTLYSNNPADKGYDFGPAGPRANSLYADPSFQAFLRSSGLEDEIAASAVARKVQSLQAAMPIQMQDLQTQGEQSRRSIDNNFESRGVFRSGQRLARQGEQEAAQARAVTSLQTGVANQIADLQGTLAQQVAANQRRASELGLNVGTNQALDQGQEDLRKKYPEAYV